MGTQMIKKTFIQFLVFSSLICRGTVALAALNLPEAFFTNAGSDGAFAPASNVTVDLSQAATADWDSAGSDNGVYDPNKWAVVFKYSSVNIPAGVTVTFTNHPSRAPVVWLIDGDATINGTVYLNGQNYSATYGIAGEPGPGGFRGGYHYETASLIGSGGFGPGGNLSRETDTTRRDGSYATVGAAGGPIYGNNRILPLIGGSGGGGGAFSTFLTGGAGGGAILIVVNGTLTLNGVISAQGGGGYLKPYSGWQCGHGSGGAVRLVADALGGAVSGGVTVEALDSYAAQGRIRLEANSVTGDVRFYPQTYPVAPDDPVLIWPPNAAPSVKVLSIGEVDAPDDPRASLEVGQSDVVVEHSETTRIVLQTQNVDTVNGTVQVRVLPKSGNAFLVNAVFESGTQLVGTWVAEATLPDGFFTLQAIAKNPEE
jgi:plastocyanin